MKQSDKNAERNVGANPKEYVFKYFNRGQQEEIP